MSELHDQLEEVVEDMGLDAEIEDLELEGSSSSDSSTGVEMETRQVTWVKPFKPGEDYVGDEVRTFVLQDGSQVSITVKKRVQCPTCEHVLAEEGEPQQLSGSCTECGAETCHRCKNSCTACGAILCGECSQGHGVKDETYCSSHRGDVDEEVEFGRELDVREHDHSERMDELQHELKKKEKEKKLELQEERQKREQIRRDWKLILQQFVDNGDNDDDQEEKDDDVFGGSGAFSGGADLSGGNESSENDWFDSIEDEIDEKIGSTER